MSSVLRSIREPTPISKRFTVFPYYGYNENAYYFTVDNDSLYRIEADLSGNNNWVVARDIGKEMRISSIDAELIEFWENQNGWSNITVIRPGRARKFQALAIPNGNIDASYNNGPAWNAGAYTKSDAPYYSGSFTGINDPLVMGNATTTISNNYNQNLPFATFYAVVDPVVIQYQSGGSPYTRAIVNRVVSS